MQTIRTILINLLVAVTSLAFSLGVVEIVCRMTYPDWQSIWAQRFLYFDESQGQWKGIPNFRGKMTDVRGEFVVDLSLDKDGFRNSSEKSNADGVTFVLGDSFAFGWGVNQEKTFSAQLEKLIGGRVVNLGVPGTDIYDYLRTLEIIKTFDNNRPTVLITVTVENDLIVYGSNTGRATKENSGHRVRHFVNWLSDQSAFFSVATALAKSNSIIVAAVRRLGLLSSGVGGGQSHTQAIQSSVEMLSRIRQQIPYARIFVLVVPPRRTFNLEKLHHDFVVALGLRSFHVIDPGAEFATADHHFPIDGHWNERGHYLIARTIASHIENGVSVTSTYRVNDAAK